VIASADALMSVTARNGSRGGLGRSGSAPWPGSVGRWIAYAGLAITLYVALRLIWEGNFRGPRGDRAKLCWKLYREIREGAAEHAGVEMLAEAEDPSMVIESTKTLGEALWQIVVADVSMSLDNVLAVAGAAHERPWIMAGGLVLSIALMGIAATVIARLLDRYRWLAWVGLIVITYVALKMIWDGGWDIEQAVVLA
jgi:predicted tellurium resistance membrane protein TerC